MDTEFDQHTQLIVKLFFDLTKKDVDGKVFCRCCENHFKDNKGFFLARYYFAYSCYSSVLLYCRSWKPSKSCQK